MLSKTHPADSCSSSASAKKMVLLGSSGKLDLTVKARSSEALELTLPLRLPLMAYPPWLRSGSL